jgi:magnesium transporter
MTDTLNLPATDELDPRQRAEEQEHLRVVEELLRQHDWASLRTRLAPLAPESVARILEALSPDESLQVWGLLEKERGEEILDELSDALQDSLDEDDDAPGAETASEFSGLPANTEPPRKPVMINAFELQGGRLRQIQVDSKEDLAATKPIWVDLLAPTREERQWIVDVFGLKLPDADDLT